LQTVAVQKVWEETIQQRRQLQLRAITDSLVGGARAEAAQQPRSR
jgi:hypothetical protein